MIDKRSYDNKKQNDFLKMPTGNDLTNFITQFGSILNLFGGRCQSWNGYQGQRSNGPNQNYGGYNNRPKVPNQQRKANSANPMANY